MKKLLFFFTVTFFLSTSSFSQETFFRFTQGWQSKKIYETATSYRIASLAATASYENHINFMEVSTIGDSITNWTFTIDTASTTEVRYVNNFSNILNKNIYFSGHIIGNESNEFYGILSKFSSDLHTEIWTKSYVLANGSTTFRTICQKNDTSLILGAYRQNNNDLYTTFLETDTSGNIRWQKDFDCTGDCNMKPFHILPTVDNGFIFTCFQSHINGMAGTDEFKTAVIKTDSLGNQEWRHTWGGDTTKNFGSWVVPLDDGNYLYAWTDYELSGWGAQLNWDMTVRFAKFDINGNVIWFKDLQNQIVEIDYSISQMELMPDGNIIIAASSFIEGGLIKIDQDANLIWHRELMPPGLAYEDNTASQQQMKIKGVTCTSDGGFILAGEYISSAGNMFANGFQSAYAYKLDEYGCYEPNCHVGIEEEKVLEKRAFVIYPNPANDYVVIMNDELRIMNVEIFDLFGKKVKEVRTQNLETKISIQDWTKGLYLVKVGKETQKLVVE